MRPRRRLSGQVVRRQNQRCIYAKLKVEAFSSMTVTIMLSILTFHCVSCEILSFSLLLIMASAENLSGVGKTSSPSAFFLPTHFALSFPHFSCLFIVSFYLFFGFCFYLETLKAVVWWMSDVVNWCRWQLEAVLPCGRCGHGSRNFCCSELYLLLYSCWMFWSLTRQDDCQMTRDAYTPPYRWPRRVVRHHDVSVKDLTARHELQQQQMNAHSQR